MAIGFSSLLVLGCKGGPEVTNMELNGFPSFYLPPEPNYDPPIVVDLR